MPMIIVEISGLVLAILTAIGLILTWIRNSRKDERERATLEANINNRLDGLEKYNKQVKTDLERQNIEIRDYIQHPDYGLMAIRKSQTEQQLNCVRTTTAFSGKIEVLEERLNKINGTSRRRKKSD